MLDFSVINHNEREKEELLAKQQLHLHKATEARVHMNNCADQARAAFADGALTLEPNNRPFLSGPDVAHYCFDFAQQISNLGPTLI